MKQLHNIVAPLILFCLMAAVSLPVLAQGAEGGNGGTTDAGRNYSEGGTGEHG